MSDYRDIDNSMTIDAAEEYERGPEYWRTRRMKKLAFEMSKGYPEPVLIDEPDVTDCALLKPQVE